ncbi:MAG: phasin family protein [Cycloclasticus sp.]|jgi:phasin family protein|nr:phasin family protein [Cycloclasticus sp.]MDF1689630.1 phasin family protein [Cycloclasticus sp.]MEE4291857.1 phasin family protein [Cycloclasticus sp.]
MVKDINGFTQPISKLVELNTHHFDTLMEAQKKAAEDYRTLVQQRMQTAAGIKDPVALASFVTDQMALAQSNYEKMVGNSRSMFEAMTGYNAEVIQLFQESTAQLKEEIKKATTHKTKK